MNPPALPHRAALLCLAVVAGMGPAGTLHPPGGLRPGPVLIWLSAQAFWGFLLHRLWRRPRRWSLYVGGLFLFMIGFQTYLWRLALTGPAVATLGAARDPWVFALYELPLAAGAACCLWLRRSCVRAKVAPDPAARPGEQPPTVPEP